MTPQTKYMYKLLFEQSSKAYFFILFQFSMYTESNDDEKVILTKWVSPKQP